MVADELERDAHPALRVRGPVGDGADVVNALLEGDGGQEAAELVEGGASDDGVGRLDEMGLRLGSSRGEGI